MEIEVANVALPTNLTRNDPPPCDIGPAGAGLEFRSVIKSVDQSPVLLR